MRRFSTISLIALAACAQSEREPAPVVYQGTAPSGAQSQPAPQAAQSAPTPVASYAGDEPDSRGVVAYDGYETIRARPGDTVESMAARVGIPAAELAAYNGLSTQYVPETGDELVLPARSDSYQNRTAAASSGQTTPSYQTAAPASDGTIPAAYQPSTPARAGADNSGWSAELARAAIDDTPTEAAPPPAPSPAPVPMPAPAASIPNPAPQPEPARESTPAPSPAPAPVLKAEPPETVAMNAEPAARSGGQFQRPTTAPIARPFSRTSGPDRNDGVDFATVAGDPVAAAADGSVALISKSLGGLGTIVLIRHDNQFLTVYGRLDQVKVAKGDRVQRGQIIATVADLRAPKNPHLHFEVRKGAESVDPAQFF